MDVTSLHAICITWKLIQIKLLTLAFASVCSTCSPQYPGCCLVFNHLPPKQITSKSNAQNLARKVYFGLKDTIRLNGMEWNGTKVWSYVLCRLFVRSFAWFRCDLTFSQSNSFPTERNIHCVSGIVRFSSGWLSNASTLFTSAKWFKLTRNKTVDKHSLSLLYWLLLLFCSLSFSVKTKRIERIKNGTVWNIRYMHWQIRTAKSQGQFKNSWEVQFHSEF